jgi:hypothetical protein
MKPEVQQYPSGEKKRRATLTPLASERHGVVVDVHSIRALHDRRYLDVEVVRPPREQFECGVCIERVPRRDDPLGLFGWRG